MQTKLKEITDNTIDELLQNEIILPSVYFKTFDKHAKTLDITMEDESFEKEVNEVVAKEFETINNYMSHTLSGIQELSNATQNAQMAIKNKDENELTKIYQQMQTLEEELNSLQEEMFIDSLTKTKNKKWIYAQQVNKEGFLKNSGTISLIQVDNYEYIKKKHGRLIADNLLIYVADYINHRLSEEGLNFDIAHYSKDRFIVFFYNENIKEITTNLNNMQQSLLNTTLKSKSGVIIQASYQYNMAQFNSQDSFQPLLETLYLKLKEC